MCATIDVLTNAQQTASPLFAHFVAVLALAVSAGCVSGATIDTSAMSFTSEPLIGKVIWNDLITEDLKAARRFYSELFGWTFDPSTTPDGRPYLLARSGPVYVAGMVELESDTAGITESRWLPYVSLSDVDASVSRATAAGATVAVAAKDLRMGRVAVIIDREGAVIGLARSHIGDPDDSTTAKAIGRVVWTELLSNAPLSAAQFYRDVIGYTVQSVKRASGEYIVLSHQERDRAGILKNPAQLRPPAGAPNVLIVLLDDVGFGASSAFARTLPDTLRGKARRRRTEVQPFSHDGTLFAHAASAPHGAQSPHLRHGRYHGDRFRISRLQLGAAQHNCAAGENAQAEWLFHGTVRQVPRDVRNKSHSVTAEIVAPKEGARGVIIAQGANIGGWSLNANKGKLKYCYNLGGVKRFYVEGANPISPGEHQVRMEFRYAGGGLGKGGKVTLHTDGKQVGQGDVPATLAMFFPADDGCDVGEDSGAPVAEDYGPRDNMFNGRIKGVFLDIFEGPESMAHLLKPGDALRIAMARQ